MSVNPKENWNETWNDILENPDGSINKEQLKLELADFSDLIHRMTTLTHEITGGRMSYATYPVKTILQVMEEVREEELEEEILEDRKCGECRFCGHEFE